MRVNLLPISPLSPISSSSPISSISSISHLSMVVMDLCKDTLEFVQLNHARIVTKPVEGRIDDLLERVMWEP